MSEIAASPEHDFIPFEQVRVVRALADSLRRHARTEVDAQGVSGYVLFDSTREPMGSGSTDVFMGVVSRETEQDYHQFTVSFLSMINSHSLRYSNIRELYRYNWNNTGRCVGTKITTDNYRPVVNSRYDTERGLIDTVESNVSSSWTPLTELDAEPLLSRMQLVATAVRTQKSTVCKANWGFVEGRNE